MQTANNQKLKEQREKKFKIIIVSCVIGLLLVIMIGVIAASSRSPRFTDQQTFKLELHYNNGDTEIITHTCNCERIVLHDNCLYENNNYESAVACNVRKFINL